MSQGIPAITVNRLRKGFEGASVLRDLDLTVGPGEFLVVVGANGVGKTTLLKILSTLSKPDAGKVFIRGRDTEDYPISLKREIGVVAHWNLLYEDLTCAENLRFFGRMFAIENLKNRIEQVVEQVGLKERTNHLVRTLSHGMQKRLAIARAVLHNPNVLLLDEPETGLDQEGVEMLRSLLDQRRNEHRVVVMTTHDLNKSLRWGDKVAVLAGGKIVFENTRQTIDESEFKEMYRQISKEIL